ncbi:hypothetical protein AUR64_16355 [Haloprofundus marisrubri]|uniref:Uncharacterized protein n=1 Tax=Haloprofundus marisrubri TaxID=1514971 RepID=A0A0W1R8D3_9EURY|nr:hypothetical protein [Haloprofundus marisrubri]KTG09351.1 hypothetical protein AUR64_16355 [Haloprofundus marisrubri]
MRRLFALLGIGLLLATAGLLAFGGTPHEATTWFWLACLGLSGLSFTVSAFRDEVTVGSNSLRWYVFAGVGDIFLAAATFVLSIGDVLSGAPTEVLIGSVAGALGALFLAFIGVDYVRGGVHMDLSAFA